MQTKLRILLPLAIAAIVVGLLLVSLDGKPSVTEAASLERSSDDAVASPDDATSDSSRPLVVRLIADPPTLDFHQATDTPSRLATNQLMEGLFRYRSDGTLEPAGAVSYTAAADARIFTMTLRTGALWSDGESVTAQHYVDGVLRLLDPALGAEYAWLMYDIQGAEDYNTGVTSDPNTVGVTAVDTHTLQFTMTESAAHFPSIMAMWITFPVRQDLIDTDPDWAEPGHFVGNGPYLLSTWDHDQQIVLDKNPLYHDAASVQIEQIILPVVPDDTTALQMYEDDQLDWGRYPSEELDRILSDPVLSTELRRLPRPGTYYVGVDTQLTPTTQITLRKALASSIDRSTLLTTVLEMPWRQPATGVIPPEVPGYQDRTVGHPFDLTAAQQYLQEAMDALGYTDPSEITVQLWFNRGNEYVMETVEEMWETDLGINVDVVNMEWGAYLDRLDQCNDDPAACSHGIYNAYRMGWVMDYADAENMLNVVFHPDSPFQYTGWDDATFRSLVDQARTTPDTADRVPLWQEAERILVSDTVAAIPIFHYDRNTLINPDVTYSFPPFGGPHLDQWQLPAGQTTLRIQLDADPTLDFHTPTYDYHNYHPHGGSHEVVNQLMERLFRYQEDGTIEPAGATTYTASADASVYTVTLRSDALWSDGDPVTAQHYVDGMLRLLDPGQGALYAWLMYDVAGAEDYHTGVTTDTATVGITAVDTYTLQFTLTGSTGHFPSIMALPVTFPVRQDIIDTDPNWTEAGHFVGNGPYQLTEWVHDDHLTLEASPTYHGAAGVTISTIELPITDEATALQMYENDQLDWSSYPSEEIPRILQEMPDHLVRIPRPGTYYVGINTAQAPTTNTNFLRALASSIDRRSILDDRLGMPWRTEAQGVIPPSVPGYQGSGVGYDFDVTTAQHYLNLAMAEMRIADPGDITIELWFNRGNEEVIETVEDHWESNLGINVNVVNVEWSAYLGYLDSCQATPGTCTYPTYNAYRMGWVLDYADPHNILNTVFHPDSPFQYTGWDNVRYRQLMSMTLTETNTISRTAYFQEAERILVEDEVAVIPIFHYDRNALIKSDVSFDFPPFGQPHLMRWSFATTTTSTVDSDGGTVTSPDTDVDVDFPSGAVSETVAVTYTAVYSPEQAPPGSFQFAGNAFTLEAVELSSSTPITTFSEPLTVTIRYTEGDLDGLAEELVEFLYWDGVAWVDDGITIIQRDMTNNVIVAQIEHLTEFALFSDYHRIYMPLVLRSS